MSERFARVIVGRPRAVLLGVLLLCVAVVPFALRLRLDTDPINLVPRGVPAAKAFVRFTRTFAAEQPLVTLVECDDPAALTGFADRFADALRARHDIADVRVRISGAATEVIRDHLLDLLDDHELDELGRRVSDEALRARARRLRGMVSAPGGSALVPLITADPLELLSLASARLQAGLPIDATSGYFRSRDGKALLVFVQPRVDPFNIEADRALVADLGAIARSLGARVIDGSFDSPSATPTVSFTGYYAHAPVYHDWLDRDTMVSTITSAVAVLFFFALLLGALRILPLVALPLLVGLWLTAAAAGAIYGSINAVSLAFATILLAIGIDIPIQLYNRLREELVAHPPAEALERTLARLAWTALLATLGPAVVFFACRLSDFKGLVELGVLAGVGLLVNCAMMLTVLPALLMVIPARLWMPRRRSTASGTWFAAFGRATARRPRAALALVALVALAATPLVLRVRFERRLLSSVKPAAMGPVRVQAEMERRFGESSQMLIGLVDGADLEQALARSDRWRAEGERLRRAGLIRSYESVSTVFPSEQEQLRRRARVAALNRERIASSLAAALDEAGFDAAPFAPFLRQLRNPQPPVRIADAGAELAFLVRGHLHQGADGWSAATYFYAEPAHFAEAVAALEAFARRDGGQVTGLTLMEQVLRRVLERDTLRVTAASVAALVLLLVVSYRQPRPVLAILLPLVAAWIFFGAALGATGIQLNLFNLLAVPLVVGYGIDDHVFMFHRYREDPAGGPERALATTGRPIVATSLSTMAGFAGLAAARFDGLRSLGLSGMIAVGLCLLAAMAVLPALLAVLKPE